jgi:hypothetical protein
VKIEFQGAVRCRCGGTAVNLSLHGRTSGDTDVLFSGANAPSMPDTLHEVRVTELKSTSGSQRRFRIESAERRLEFEARSAQVHRAAGDALFAAIPPPHVAWHVRAGFSLLVSVLGIPGAGRLILRRRGVR